MPRPGDVRLIPRLSGVAGEHADRLVPRWTQAVLIDTMASPAITFAWAAVELADHPDLLAAVWAEIRDVGCETMVSDPLGHGHLLGALIKETLRRHPPAWLLSRKAPRATTLAGVPIDAGQQVVVSPYLLHHDARWWDEPDNFRPARWLDGRRIVGRAYRPFGAGPRVCPGAQFSLVHLTVAVATLVAHYDVAVGGGIRPEATPLNLLAPQGVRLGLLRCRATTAPPDWERI